MNTRIGRRPEAGSNADNQHALTGAYVLDAMDAPERTLFERHLAECADCDAEVTSLRDPAGSLIAPEIHRAPTKMRATVLTRVRHADQAEPVAPTASRSGGSGTGGSVTPLARRARPARQWMAAAAAAALFAGGMGVGSIVTGADQKLGAEAAAADILTAADVGMGEMPWGNSYVLFSEERGEVALMCHDIYAAPEGTVYQLWIEHTDGTVAPSITFTPDGSGDVVAVIDVDVADVARLMITREPTGGSDAPSGDPLAAMSMT